MASVNAIKVLDHGYVRLVETWGHGDAGVREDNAFLDDYECGIIEAARQSTQASFHGWEDQTCACEGFLHNCPECGGKKGGGIPGDKRLLAFLYNNKHATPFEFAGMVIEVQAPIFVFREWHRHRTQSYNEMSARYAPLPNLNYMPTVERILMDGGRNKQAGGVKDSVPVNHRTAQTFQNNLLEVYSRCQTEYEAALRSGVPKELARILLPVGRYSRMRASANLRNWLAFVTLRSDPAAQWEIRQYSDTVGQILARQFPKTWELFRSERSK